MFLSIWVYFAASLLHRAFCLNEESIVVIGNFMGLNLLDHMWQSQFPSFAPLYEIDDSISLAQLDSGTADLALVSKITDSSLNMASFPLFAVPVRFFANLPAIYRLDMMEMSEKSIGMILSGEITHWDDEVLKQLNPTEFLPHQEIEVIVNQGEPEALEEVVRICCNAEPSLGFCSGSFAPDASFASTSGEAKDLLLETTFSFGFQVDAGQDSLTPMMVNSAEITYETVSCAMSGLCQNFVESNFLVFENEETYMCSFHEPNYPFIVPIIAAIPRTNCRNGRTHVSNVLTMIDWVARDTVLDQYATFYDIASTTYEIMDNIRESILSSVMCGSVAVEYSIFDGDDLSAPSLTYAATACSEQIGDKLMRKCVRTPDSIIPLKMEGTVVATAPKIPSLLESGVHFAFASSADHLFQESMISSTGLVDVPLLKRRWIPTIHLPNMEDDVRVRLDISTLTGVFYGCIKFWDDTAITSLNPDLTLPHLSITPYFLNDHKDPIVTILNSLSSFCSSCCVENVVHSGSLETVIYEICNTPGVIIMDIWDFGSIVCDDMVKVDMLQTPNANAQVITSEDGCDMSFDINQGCWPLGEVYHLILHEDWASEDFSKEVDLHPLFNSLYKIYGTFNDDISPSCFLYGLFIFDIYSLFDGGDSLIGMFSNSYEMTPQIITEARDLIKTLKCDGSLVYPHSGSDTLANLFWIFLVLLCSIVFCFLHYLMWKSYTATKARIEKMMTEQKGRGDTAEYVLGYVNHEIRNILNGAMGLSIYARETLTEAMNKTDVEQLQTAIMDATKDVNTVVQACEMLNIVVNDVMKLRMLEEGKVKSELTPVSFVKLVNNILKIFRPKFNEKPNVDIRVRFFKNADQLMFMVDSVHVLQVLANFISNAQKFTDTGSITIEIHRNAVMETVRISVSDTGCGIPKNLQPNIFHHKWIQANTAHRFHGSGFGLYLCRGLVMNVMNGRLGFESVPKIGSKFWFEVSATLCDEMALNSVGNSTPLQPDEISEISTQTGEAVDASVGSDFQMIGRSHTIGGGGNRARSMLMKPSRSLLGNTPAANEMQRRSLKAGYDRAQVKKKPGSENDVEMPSHWRGSQQPHEQRNRTDSVSSLVFRFMSPPMTIDNNPTTTTTPPILSQSSVSKPPSRPDGVSSNRISIGTSHGIIINDDKNSHKPPMFPSLKNSSPGRFANRNNKANNKSTITSLLKTNDATNMFTGTCDMHEMEAQTSFEMMNTDTMASVESVGNKKWDGELGEKSPLTVSLLPNSSSAAAQLVQNHIKHKKNGNGKSTVKYDTLFKASHKLTIGSSNNNGKKEEKKPVISPVSQTGTGRILSWGKNKPSRRVVPQTATTQKPSPLNQQQPRAHNTQSTISEEPTNLGSSEEPTRTASDSKPKRSLTNGTTSSETTRANSILTPNPLENIIQGKKFLVVDDSPVNRLIIRRALEKQGAIVSLAADGEQALDIYVKSRRDFGMIWMDVQMPKMDGLEATKELRQRNYKRAIVACTGNVQPTDKEACLNAGMNSVEGKPLTPARIVAVSSYYLEKFEEIENKADSGDK